MEPGAATGDECSRAAVCYCGSGLHTVQHFSFLFPEGETEA